MRHAATQSFITSSRTAPQQTPRPLSLLSRCSLSRYLSRRTVAGWDWLETARPHASFAATSLSPTSCVVGELEQGGTVSSCGVEGNECHNCNDHTASSDCRYRLNPGDPEHYESTGRDT